MNLDIWICLGFCDLFFVICRSVLSLLGGCGNYGSAGIRSLTSQLAEDLAWLEEHRRPQPRQAKAGTCAWRALVRNVVGLFFNQLADPLHVAVVGGAGAGKSTRRQPALAARN